jgi:hypothetical protein
MKAFSLIRQYPNQEILQLHALKSHLFFDHKKFPDSIDIQCNLSINKTSIIKTSHVLCESLFTYTVISKLRNSSITRLKVVFIFLSQ